MPSTAEALNSILDPETNSPHLTIVPKAEKAPLNHFGSTVNRGGERIRSGLRTRPVDIFGKPLKDYTDPELRAAIKRVQRNFQKT